MHTITWSNVAAGYVLLVSIRLLASRSVRACGSRLVIAEEDGIVHRGIRSVLQLAAHVHAHAYISFVHEGVSLVIEFGCALIHFSVAISITSTGFPSKTTAGDIISRGYLGAAFSLVLSASQLSSSISFGPVSTFKLAYGIAFCATNCAGT